MRLMYWCDYKNILQARKLLEKDGIELIVFDDISVLEEKIWDSQPDVLLCNCHPISTPQDGFERIKLLTRQVRNRLPDCLILVTYRPTINARWASLPLFGRTDHLDLFSLLGSQNGYTGYEKDFLMREDFLDSKNLVSLTQLVEITKSYKSTD